MASDVSDEVQAATDDTFSEVPSLSVAAARHWIVLVLVAEVAMPHPGPFVVQLGWLAAWLGALVTLLAAGALTAFLAARRRRPQTAVVEVGD